MRRVAVPVVLVAVVVASVALVGALRGEEPAGGPAQAQTENRAPYGPGAEVGETYEYVLYTHCGVEWTRIDGAWWRTTPLDDGDASAPDGWGDPYEAGALELLDGETATFRGGPGPDLVFERTEALEPPSLCA